MTATSAHAAEAIDDAFAALRQNRHATAHFTEYRTTQMLTQPLESSGTLTWDAPSHLEKDTLQPQPEQMIVDGDSLTIRRQNETRTLALSDYPPLSALVECLRATLAGDLPALQNLYAVKFAGTPAQWRMELEPKDAKTRDIVMRITLTGGGTAIRKIETLESNGDQSLMNITPDAP